MARTLEHKEYIDGLTQKRRISDVIEVRLVSSHRYTNLMPSGVREILEYDGHLGYP